MSTLKGFLSDITIDELYLQSEGNPDIAVAIIDSQGQIVPNANISPRVNEHNLLAPGKQIVSTAAGGGYQQMTRTSVAAAFITGVAALLWSLVPQASAQSVHDALLQRTR